MKDGFISLSCLMCGQQISLQRERLFPQREYLYHCRQCQRAMIFSLQEFAPAMSEKIEAEEFFAAPVAAPPPAVFEAAASSMPSIAAFLEPLPSQEAPAAKPVNLELSMPSISHAPPATNEEMNEFQAPDPRSNNIPDFETEDEGTATDDLGDFLRSELKLPKTKNMPAKKTENREPTPRNANRAIPQNEKFNDFLEDEFKTKSSPKDKIPPAGLPVFDEETQPAVPKSPQQRWVEKPLRTSAARAEEPTTAEVPEESSENISPEKPRVNRRKTHFPAPAAIVLILFCLILGIVELQLQPIRHLFSLLSVKPVTEKPRETTPTNAIPAPESRSIQVPAPAEIKLRPDIMEKAKLYLRREFPDKAKEDLLQSIAAIAVQRNGPQALEGKTEEVAERLKAIMLKEFPQILDFETLRGDKLPPAPLSSSEQVDIGEFMGTVSFHNSLVRLTQAVKFRDYDALYEIEPQILRAQLNPTEIRRFYLPIFSEGEIFSFTPTLVTASENMALVRIQYLLAPYIKIDPSKIVFGDGLATQIRRRYPVRSADIMYAFLPNPQPQKQKDDRWQALPYSPTNAKMLKEFYPQIKWSQQPEEPKIEVRTELVAPRDLVKPTIE